MLASGETLLKITDFPFVYSVFSLVFGINSSNFQNNLPFLAIAGFTATFLIIVDPVGLAVKFALQSRLKLKKIMAKIDDYDSKFGFLIKPILKRKLESKKKKNIEYDIDTFKISYELDAIKTKGINIHIDRIVSVWYFIITIFIFIIMLFFNDNYIDHFVGIKIFDNSIFHNKDEAKIIVTGVSSGIIFLLIFLIREKWKQLLDAMITSGMYQIGISSEYALKQNVLEMGKSIEQDDWQTAKRWRSIVENDIISRRGKHDVLVQEIDTVYKPLYFETVEIQRISDIIGTRGIFSPFQTSKWSQVMSTIDYLKLDDHDLKSSISNFYSLVESYNKIANTIEQKISSLMLNKASLHYKMNVLNLVYTIEDKNTQTSPALTECLFMGMHPLQSTGRPSKPKSIRISFQESSGSISERLMSEYDLKSFDGFWAALQTETNDHPDIKSLKAWLMQISNTNNNLQNKFIEKFKSV